MGLLGTALKANPWGAIAAGIGGLAGIGKAVVGGIQASRGRKEFKSLMGNRPMFEIPEEYGDVLSTYKRLSESEKFPGQDIMEGKIGQATARATQSAKEGAVSSTAYQSAVGDIYQKELDALQNLSLQAEQYKTSQQDKLAGAQQMMGGLKSDQWNINQYVPWQTNVINAAQRGQTGQQNLFEGMGSFANQMSNFAGTDAYLNIFKQMNQTPVEGQKFAPQLKPPQMPPMDDWKKYKGTLNG
jgi:hypothetical protein